MKNIIKRNGRLKLIAFTVIVLSSFLVISQSSLLRSHLISKFSSKNPVLVTLVDQRSIKQLAKFIGAYQEDSNGHLPKTVVYGVNLLKDQQDMIVQWENVFFVDVLDISQSRYNNFIIEKITVSLDEVSLPTKWYNFWQILAINHATEIYDSVLFVNPNNFVSYAEAVKYMEKGYLFFSSENEKMCNSSVIGVMHSSVAYNTLMRPLTDCYLTKGCFDYHWKEKEIVPKTGLGTEFECTKLKLKPIESIDDDVVKYIHKRQSSIESEKEAKKQAEELINKHKFEHEGHKHESDPLMSNFDQIILEPEEENSSTVEHTHVGGRILSVTETVKTSPPWDVALLIISTTKGMDPATMPMEDLPIFTILLKSFKETTAKDDINFRYHFYLGYDEGDSFYDGEEKQNVLKKYFDEFMKGYDITYKAMKYPPKYKAHTSGMWSVLALESYDDGMDFMYQLNDDIHFLTPNWATALTNELINAKIPFFGVTGPADKRNDRILTQTMVHRNHVEIFGCLIPGLIRNSYGDDWLTEIYNKDHTYRTNDVVINNTNKFGTRWVEDGAVNIRWIELKAKGCLDIRDYIQARKLDMVWECAV